MMWCSVKFYSEFLLVFTIIFLHVTVAVPINPKNAVFIVHADNSSVKNDGASETQQATCKIVTDKLVATASATVTQALTGVCTSEELEKNFIKWRSNINQQMEPFKMILGKMESQLADLYKVLLPKNVGLQNREIMEFTGITRGLRETEIKKHNFTVHTDTNGGQVFSYFWKLAAITHKLLQEDQHIAYRSPSFYVNNAYKMYIKLFPHQSKGNVYIHVGLTSGLYDDQLAWPFKLKHQVTILDQTSPVAEDIASRVWDPSTLCSPQDWQRPEKSKDSEECVGFGFSKTTILTGHYIFNDSLLIRLDVFLS